MKNKTLKKTKLSVPTDETESEGFLNIRNSGLFCQFCRSLGDAALCAGDLVRVNNTALYGLIHSRRERGAVFLERFKIFACRGVLGQSLDAAAYCAVTQCACFRSTDIFF